MDNEERQAILDEIIRLTSIPFIRSDEFTVYDYLDRLEERGEQKPARCTVRGRLDRLVEKGRLSKRRVLRDGKVHMAYKPTGDIEG